MEENELQDKVQEVCNKYLCKLNQIANRLALRDELLALILPNIRSNDVFIEVIPTEVGVIRIVPYYKGKEIVATREMTFLQAIIKAVRLDTNLVM